MSESMASNKFWSEYARKMGAKDSCGTEAAVGKVGPDAGVLPDARSESQQNCAGLGAEWGIPPAGIDFPEQSGNGVGGSVALQVTTEVNPREASGNEEPPQQVQILPADSQNLCTICGKPFEKNHPPAYWRGLLFHRPDCQMEYLNAHAAEINHRTGKFTPSEVNNEQ